MSTEEQLLDVEGNPVDDSGDYDVHIDCTAQTQTWHPHTDEDKAARRAQQAEHAARKQAEADADEALRAALRDEKDPVAQHPLVQALAARAGLL